MEVNKLSNEFLYQLAKKYDPSAIAVRVIVNRPKTYPQGRNADGSPFWGGARINALSIGQCTDGFSWKNPTKYFMITAGHCGAGGAAITTPLQSMGNIAQTETSWSNGTGSIQLGGAWRGDIALIRISSPWDNQPKIYRGGVGSNTGATVKEMWSRSPQDGDSYCTGGAYSGELCGWSTEVGAGNWTYSTGEVARHVAWGVKGGACTTDGDSGGPVYTVRSDGGIAAKGIHDGGGHYNNCIEVYSDIWDAWAAFTGTLNTG